MKKHYLLLIVAIFICTAADAAERTWQQKRQIALSVLGKQAQTRAAQGGELKLLKETKSLSVLGYDGGGFAVISNDDRHEAVLGVSDGRFNPDNLSDSFKWWLNAANRVLEEGGDYVRSITPATAGNETLPNEVESFVTAKWGQGDPYNQQCPNMQGTKALTGCVATAAAQIMYYYGYPTTGMGEAIFDPESFDFIDFANTTYDYGNMIPDYSQGYTQAQAVAVATLMHHCGVATQMSYGTDASGAYSYIAAGAWRDHFGFSTEFYRREAFKQKEWMSMIYEELAQRRPIQYGGVDEGKGGHSFVLDGYDADGLVHVNWGWEGNEDGCYDIALLNPEGYTFSLQQDMIFMHTPDAPAFTYRSQWGIMTGGVYPGDFTVSVDGHMLSWSAAYLVNVDSDTFTGQLALIAEPASGGQAAPIDVINVVGENGLPVEVSFTGGYESIENTCDISDLSNGTYYIYLASKATTPQAETAWQPIHCGDGVNERYLLTINNGDIDVSTGIKGITMPDVDTSDRRIYSIDGRYVGTDATQLPKGMYIRGGKKFVRR